MPFAGSSLFPIKATNAEILPHDQCVFRRYAIILSPTHPTKSRPCTLRARRSPKSTRARGHPSWTEMNLRVGININWFARLRGTAFQNIVPIFVSRFPSFGRGFDSHRPFHKTLALIRLPLRCSVAKEGWGGRKTGLPTSFVDGLLEHYAAADYIAGDEVTVRQDKGKHCGSEALVVHRDHREAD